MFSFVTFGHTLFLLGSYKLEVIWWLTPWCISIKFWVQILMNACINVHSLYYTLMYHVQM